MSKQSTDAQNKGSFNATGAKAQGASHGQAAVFGQDDGHVVAGKVHHTPAPAPTKRA